ncbi:MAG TPA: type II toxin-antitoxin system RelE/ParE family toxin [Planctomycetota bacterium]
MGSDSDSEMRVLETTIFTRQIEKLLGDDEKQNLLDYLIAAPDAGKVIKGSGGIRKVRWSGSGRGKRGGVRVIYYWQQTQIMYLLVAYPKNKKDDLSAAELKVLEEVVQQEIA